MHLKRGQVQQAERIASNFQESCRKCSLQNYLNIYKDDITSNIRSIDHIIGDIIQDTMEDETDEVANGKVQE